MRKVYLWIIIVVLAFLLINVTMRLITGSVLRSRGWIDGRAPTPIEEVVTEEKEVEMIVTPEIKEEVDVEEIYSDEDMVEEEYPPEKTEEPTMEKEEVIEGEEEELVDTEKTITVASVSTTGPVQEVEKSTSSASNSKFYYQTKEDVILGEETAPVTIVEYFSFYCHFCPSFHKTLMGEFKKQYIDTGKVKLISRSLSSDGAGLYGSIAINCFKNKYYFLLNILLVEEQSSWIGGVTAHDAKEKLLDIVSFHGLNESKYEACTKDAVLHEKISRDADEYIRTLNISATPTFFVNGKKYTGTRSLEQLKEIVDNI